MLPVGFRRSVFDGSWRSHFPLKTMDLDKKLWLMRSIFEYRKLLRKTDRQGNVVKLFAKLDELEAIEYSLGKLYASCNSKQIIDRNGYPRMKKRREMVI